VAENAKTILFENPALLKRLAKYTVQQCFRNTVLEEFHAGTVPDSRSGDFSDVVVKTPYGEIPWSGLSRLSDEEMKLVMRDAVNKTINSSASCSPRGPEPNSCCGWKNGTWSRSGTTLIRCDQPRRRWTKLAGCLRLAENTRQRHE
jgi:hypothetical protein